MNPRQDRLHKSRRHLPLQLPPAMEPLEDRLLLNAAPVFATALKDTYAMIVRENPDTFDRITDGSGLYVFSPKSLGINATDADGDALTISAVSDNPDITATVQARQSFAKLTFVKSDGVTVIGTIVVQLFESKASTATSRFIKLATKHINADGTTAATGTPFYTNVTVHRVIPYFMVQTGDASKGDGTGGSPLGAFNDPTPLNATLGFGGTGVLAMANSGPNTNDCQFFLTEVPTTWLDTKHLIFGQVISGMSVLHTLANLPRDIAGNTNRPYDPPLLKSVQIISDNHDGTVTLSAADGFNGTAHVTVTVSDGHGGITTKIITMTPETLYGSRPTIADPGQQLMTSGTPFTFLPTVSDDLGSPMTITAKANDSRITTSVNATTGQVTINAPATYSGMFEVTVWAVEKGVADLMPTSRTFLVLSQSLVAPPVQSHPTDVTGTTMGSAQTGNYLYVAMGSAGVGVYSLADPAHPALLQTLNTGGTARDVKISGTRMFVANSAQGIVSYDITDPANPVQKGTAAVASFAVTMTVSGNTLWVADYSAGATAFNVTDLSAMTKITTIKQVTSTFVIGNIVDVEIKGNYLLTSDSYGGIEILNVTDPLHPTAVNSFATGNSPFGTSLQGSLLYVADQGIGLEVWDVSNMLSPKKLGQLPLTGPWQVTVIGNLAIVGMDRGAAFVDVSNPAAMVQEAGFSSPSYGGGASASGPNVVLTLNTEGFVVLRASRTIANRSKVLTDGAGVPVTVNMQGGTARVLVNGLIQGNISGIDVTGSTSTSSLTITTPTGKTTPLADVNVSGSLQSLSAGTSALGGNLTVAGSLENLSLGSASGEHTIGINASGSTAKVGAKLTMTVGTVTDLSITSTEPISSLTAGAWTDTASSPTDLITAPWIGALTGNGKFGASLTLSGAGSPGTTLSTATIAGSLTGGTWNITGPTGTVKAASSAAAWQATLGAVTSLTFAGACSGTIRAKSVVTMTVGGDFKNAALTLTKANTAANQTSLGTLNVTGWIDNVELRSAGSIGTIKAKGVRNHSRIFAGVMDSVTELPQTLADFNVSSNQVSLSKAASINSFTLTGVAGQPSFIDSSMAALVMGTISLQQIQTDNTANSGRTLGIAAAKITSYSSLHGTATYTWPGTGSWPADDQGNYEVQKITGVTWLA